MTITKAALRFDKEPAVLTFSGNTPSRRNTLRAAVPRAGFGLTVMASRRLVSDDRIMRNVVAGLMLLILTASANAGPKEEAFAVIEQFKQAYDGADPPAIVKLFAPDSIFLGTTMQKPTRGKETILKYFQASASVNLPKHVEIENYEALQVSESAILFTGQNVFFRIRDGKEVPTLARFTFLIIKGPQGWSIGHFHSSRRPKAQ